MNIRRKALGEKQVSLRHEGGLRFVARTGTGHDIVMDNATGDSGPRPTELILVAIAGCTAMDITEIMAKKRQAVDRYSVELKGVQREKSPNVFMDITIEHVIEGAVDTEAVRRSIELSATKYCTVSAQIAPGPTRISHRYLIKRPGVDGAPSSEESGEVVVTGPMADVLGE
jgi:putative redox protein